MCVCVCMCVCMCVMCVYVCVCVCVFLRGRAGYLASPDYRVREKWNVCHCGSSCLLRFLCVCLWTQS